MEKLSITSAGVSETPTGLQAVAMFYRLNDDGVQARFSFKANVLTDSIVVRWPSDSDVAIVPPETGAALVSHTYARYLFPDEVEQYNGLVDAMLTGEVAPVVLDPATSGGPLVESQVESPDGTPAPVSGDSVPAGTPPVTTPDSPVGVVSSSDPAPVAPTPATAPVTPPAPPVAAPAPPPVAVPPASSTGKDKTK